MKGDNNHFKLTFVNFHHSTRLCVVAIYTEFGCAYRLNGGWEIGDSGGGTVTLMFGIGVGTYFMPQMTVE